jgi:hypothetical protein
MPSVQRNSNKDICTCYEQGLRLRRALMRYHNRRSTAAGYQACEARLAKGSSDPLERAEGVSLLIAGADILLEFPLNGRHSSRLRHFLGKGSSDPLERAFAAQNHDGHGMITAARSKPAKMLSVRPSAYQPHHITKGDINPCVSVSPSVKKAANTQQDRSCASGPARKGMNQ